MGKLIWSYREDEAAEPSSRVAAAKRLWRSYEHGKQRRPAGGGLHSNQAIPFNFTDADRFSDPPPSSAYKIMTDSHNILARLDPLTPTVCRPRPRNLDAPELKG